MIYLVTRAIVFLGLTLGGSFAFLVATTPGNSEPSLLSYDSEDYQIRASQLEGRLSEVDHGFSPILP